jgi:predicted ATPase
MVGQGNASVCFVDLAVVSDPGLVPTAIASAVGHIAAMTEPLPGLGAYLQHMQLLLIIDNCEHLIGAVAETVEVLLHAAVGLRILTTSRELLQAQGEHAVPLGPLPCPNVWTAMTVAEALRYPAIELFAERARAAHDSFRVTDQNVNTIAAICRRLDGIPLGIELVAARTGALGLDTLLHSLEQGSIGVPAGRRASGRHQSLAATLQWSFNLLSPEEQTILQRISTFRDLFSAQAAQAVAADGDICPMAVADALMSLLQRSLLVADTSGSHVRYRLLYVTRAFASARLAQTGEANDYHRRHAQYHCQVLESAALQWDKVSRRSWRALLGIETADLRASLEWAFGPEGDVAIGARLFVASLPLGAECGPREFETRARRTLEVLRSLSVRDMIAELRVRIAASVLFVQSGTREEDWRLEIERITGLALQVGEPLITLEALTVHTVTALEGALYVAAVQRFEMLENVTRQADDAFASLVTDRVGAQVFHWAGDQKKARVRAERALRSPAFSIPVVYGHSPVDLRVSMRIILARVAWLEGHADEAREIAATALSLAPADAPVDLCHTLGFAACPIALWRGDQTEARGLIGQLLEHSRQHGFLRWHRLGLCYQQCLEDEPPGASDPAISALLADLLGTVDMRWANGDSLRRAEGGAAGWCTPELLRAAGEGYRLDPQADGQAMAELRFRAALEYARGQGALAWELRIATSLARLRADAGHRLEARGTLESVCGKFTEGLRTADYRAAISLLEQI